MAGICFRHVNLYVQWRARERRLMHVVQPLQIHACRGKSFFCFSVWTFFWVRCRRAFTSACGAGSPAHSSDRCLSSGGCFHAGRCMRLHDALLSSGGCFHAGRCVRLHDALLSSGGCFYAGRYVSLHDALLTDSDRSGSIDGNTKESKSYAGLPGVLQSLLCR